jgi:putative transposase
LSVEVKRGLVETDSEAIPVARQCQLLSLSRSSLYYQPRPQSLQRHKEREEELQMMRLLDEQYTHTPFYGSRRMTVWLRQQGYSVNRKRVGRLLREMGLHAVYPGPKLSVAHPGHRIYPYLLRDLAIEQVDQVWSTDITYIRLQKGFVYLAAIIDWYSRYVIDWELSTTLDGSFCQEILRLSLEKATPEIFNTDQGSQFTSSDFTGLLEQAQVRISMDGRGRALDNIFIERLWRTVKYEEVYLKDYDSPRTAALSLGDYFHFYNEERPHQSLNYQTPGSVYRHENTTE